MSDIINILNDLQNKYHKGLNISMCILSVANNINEFAKYDEFYQIDKYLMVNILNDCNAFVEDTAEIIINNLYRVYGLDAVSFLPNIRINTTSDSAKRILGPLIQIKLLKDLAQDIDKKDDEEIEVDWQFYYKKTQKKLQNLENQFGLAQKI